MAQDQKEMYTTMMHGLVDHHKGGTDMDLFILEELAKQYSTPICIKIGPDDTMTISIFGGRREWLNISTSTPSSEIYAVVEELIRRSRQ